MITLITAGGKHVLTPTIFPDGTSQVWKLPNQVLRSSSVDVDWRFESEREIIDLLSLTKLIKNSLGNLHVPYLPYGRQDKEVSNASTFNLEVFADLINSMEFSTVSSIDAHNPRRTEELINNFDNISANEFHREVVERSNPTFIVFPDAGAAERYHDSDIAHIPRIICEKTRDQLTGNITGHEIVYGYASGISWHEAKFLIIDDLCDGGATFISVANMLRRVNTLITVDLCVTHGLFSKGEQTLLTNGIDKLYTTNSLTKNEKDGFKV